MSIPKVIHYCWFGKGEMPKLALKCIKSWKKYCPDYEIICWNEDNFDITQNRYMQEAYEAKKWAFVSDFARLKVIYDHGGIYMDTDVEILKPIDDLLETKGYMGFDEKGLMSTGLGFGAEKGNKIVGEFLKSYEDIPFVLPDGTYDLTPCPDRNTATLTRLGMDMSKEYTDEEINALPRGYAVRFAQTASRFRDELIAKYGEEAGSKVRFAEAFMQRQMESNRLAMRSGYPLFAVKRASKANPVKMVLA